MLGKDEIMGAVKALQQIRRLIGPMQVETTGRWADLANDPWMAAANRIACRVSGMAG